MKNILNQYDYSNIQLLTLSSKNFEVNEVKNAEGLTKPTSDRESDGDMTKEIEDALLQEIQFRMAALKSKIDIGVPLKKLESERWDIKKNLLMKWIKIQRSKDLSYQKIEDILNQENVPTLTGMKKWNARTIYNIVKKK